MRVDLLVAAETHNRTIFVETKRNLVEVFVFNENEPEKQFFLPESSLRIEIKRREIFRKLQFDRNLLFGWRPFVASRYITKFPFSGCSEQESWSCWKNSSRSNEKRKKRREEPQRRDCDLFHERTIVQRRSARHVVDGWSVWWDPCSMFSVSICLRRKSSMFVHKFHRELLRKKRSSFVELFRWRKRTGRSRSDPGQAESSVGEVTCRQKKRQTERWEVVHWVKIEQRFRVEFCSTKIRQGEGRFLRRTRFVGENLRRREEKSWSNEFSLLFGRTNSDPLDAKLKTLEEIFLFVESNRTINLVGRSNETENESR